MKTILAVLVFVLSMAAGLAIMGFIFYSLCLTMDSLWKTRWEALVDDDDDDDDDDEDEDEDEDEDVHDWC